mgnify:CR=1 FL=1
MTDSSDYQKIPHIKREARYSNVSKLLGMSIKQADAKEGIIEASFEAQECFYNYIGNVQGGILTAMLDDLMGHAANITLTDTQFAPTGNMNISFLKSTQQGTLTGRGEILKREGNIFHLAAKLYNAENELICSATSKAKVVNVSG